MKPVDSTPELPRLRDASTSALTAALHELSARGPDASELASLASRLSLQGISMTPPSSAASPRPPVPRRLGWQLAVTGAVAVGAAAWWLWPVPVASRAPAPAAPAASMAPLDRASDVLPRVERARNEAPPTGLSATPPEGTAEPSRASATEPGAAPAPELPPASPSNAPARPGTSPSHANATEPQVAAEPPRDTPALRQSSKSLTPSAASESEGPSGAATAPSELELLRAARLALKSSPAEALRLAEQHRSVYPSGKLTQERELIAISALVALGRRTSALSRAGGFERAFPTSPYRKQIGELLQ